MNARMRFGPGAAARFALAGLLALFLCWQHVQAVRLGYHVETARRIETERRGRVAALHMAVEEGLSPAAIAARADRLGLVPAPPDALRRLPARTSARGLFGLNWTRRRSPTTASRG